LITWQQVLVDAALGTALLAYLISLPYLFNKIIPKKVVTVEEALVQQLIEYAQYGVITPDELRELLKRVRVRKPEGKESGGV
jgi:hypothetical protein